MVLRYETDGTATVLGGWRGAGMPAVTGRRLTVEGEGVARVGAAHRPASAGHAVRRRAGSMTD